MARRVASMQNNSKSKFQSRKKKDSSRENSRNSARFPRGGGTRPDSGRGSSYNSERGGAYSRASDSGRGSSYTSERGGAYSRSSDSGRGSSYNSERGGVYSRPSDSGRGSSYTSERDGAYSRSSDSGRGSSYNSERGGAYSRSSDSGRGSSYNSERGGAYSRSSDSGRGSSSPNRKFSLKNPRGKSFNSSPKRNRFLNSNIDISKLISKAKLVEAKVYVPKHSFAELPLHQKLKDNITQKGFTTPTAIQDQAIPVCIQGKDIIGLANTGTGKTAAFLLPMIDKIYNNKQQKLLVMVPTRELALQVHQDFVSFSKGLNMYSALCIGGANIRSQIGELRRNPNIVIGTPGRLKDLIRQKELKLQTCHNVVLDEADRMFDMGFISDITYLLSQLPEERQVLLFSATLPTEIKNIIQRFQKNPVTISVLTGETSQNVEQDVIRISDTKQKMKKLQELLSQKDFSKVIIFGRTKHGVKNIENSLFEMGFKVASIHGDKTQGARQKALRQFKEHKIQAFIATDIAARGLDIPNVTHVINFDLPANYEDYTHRIGRTGRAGKKGVALTFVSN